MVVHKIYTKYYFSEVMKANYRDLLAKMITFVTHTQEAENSRMKIIILSGGSGTRLWPLSNDARSKQFLRLLTSPDGSPESMIQRVIRQITTTGLCSASDIVVAIAAVQKDAIELQLGSDVDMVTEPSRRDTYPAIMLACAHLAAEGVDADEPVIVVPCDTYADNRYFASMSTMVRVLDAEDAQIVLMGISPTYPSAKYGYIVPCQEPDVHGVVHVNRFIEKPDVVEAEKLISDGAMWNGGVFAFRLKYMLDVMERVMPGADVGYLRAHYDELKKTSFDYAVVEQASSVAMVPYFGRWKDLGTWNTLTDELPQAIHGNVLASDCRGSYIINELEIPIVGIGVTDTVIAASPDGILVSRLSRSEELKHVVGKISRRPMYEERRWGEYKVIDNIEFDDGYSALTKQLTLQPGKSISYQRHQYRDEIWTFINGEGEIVLNGERRPVKRGDVITISRMQLHALKAYTPLTFIEVQQGSNLIEEDIERFPFEW